MIQELSIRNFAIIPSLSVSFHEGMTVLTGETGAGKSIIIDAMSLLVGSRGSADYIRKGADHCTLEGLFSLPQIGELKEYLEKAGIEIDEDQTLILQRELFFNGKNICRINGHLVNTAHLRQVGQYLVDIHGQNELQELMRADRHLGMLDEFGKKKLSPLKNNYQKRYQEYQELSKKVKQRQTNEKEFAQRIDMLRFQSEEIMSGELISGEEEGLIEERDRLNNFQKITEAIGTSLEILTGGNNATLDQIAIAMDTMLEIEPFDERYHEIAESIQNAYYLLQDASSNLNRELDTMEMDEERSQVVSDRLEVIRQLKRKYGDSIESILSYYESISKELLEAEALENQEDQLAELLAAKKKELLEAGQLLSLTRKKTAQKLEEAILKQLKELYMEKAQFEVKFISNNKDFNERGIDQVEFYITTNPGEPLKPLVKVASGGELSRIMLALKTIFAKAQELTSIVFDEVDTGVSGRVAQAIAEKIYQISKHSQVLCITHLPQVAAVADEHYFIQKSVHHERTETSLRSLTKEKRVQEIARMLSGSQITQLTLEHAQELLEMARIEK